MKKTPLVLVAILSAGIIYSCNSSSDTTTSTDSTTMTTDSSTLSSETTPATDTTASMSTAPLEKMDRDFVMKAAGAISFWRPTGQPIIIWTVV